VLVEKFQNPPNRYQDSLLWALLGGINSKKKTLSADTDFFKLKTLKGTAKAPAVKCLKVNTLRCTKTTFLIPERYGRIYNHFSKVQKL